MARSISSGGSSSRSASSSWAGLEGEATSSPIPYREGPLEYWPAQMCKCGKKAARWISWSDDNPGRRYLTCLRRRLGGCDLWIWAENSTTTPFVRQLLVDLRDMVWRLKRERREMQAELREAKRMLQEQRAIPEAELRALQEQLQAKDNEISVLRARVSDLEKQKRMFAYGVAGCAALLMYFRPWM
ncbi:unnamed protein product [Urochloa decumbens]|uniref:GRF-type domain-containing protein n=1 Tax=Urochloa decumbens TaxID=240449 RepID=A0ABC8X0R7_9POAL